MHKSYKKSLKKQSLKKKSLQKKHKNTKKRKLAQKQRGGAGSARSARSAGSSNLTMAPLTSYNMHRNEIYYSRFTPEELKEELDEIKQEFIKLRAQTNLTNNTVSERIKVLKRNFKLIQDIILSTK